LKDLKLIDNLEDKRKEHECLKITRDYLHSNVGNLKELLSTNKHEIYDKLVTLVYKTCRGGARQFQLELLLKAIEDGVNFDDGDQKLLDKLKEVRVEKKRDVQNQLKKEEVQSDSSSVYIHIVNFVLAAILGVVMCALIISIIKQCRKTKEVEKTKKKK
jgi:hypothetical protein